MGRLGEAALAEPTNQRSSWLAVNRPVNSGAYVLTLGLWKAKIASAAQAGWMRARRQHVIGVPLTLAPVAICSLCFCCTAVKTTLTFTNFHQPFQDTSDPFCVTFYSGSQLTFGCSCQRSFCGFEMEEVPDSDSTLRTSRALPLASYLYFDVFSVLCILKAANPFDSACLQREADAVFVKMLGF